MKWKFALMLVMVLFTIQPSFAQKANKKIKITGSVVDANRKPVEGVMIIVDGTKTNIVTNAQGVYSVKVAPTAQTITAFSLFNGVKEMPINGQTAVNIVLDGVNPNTGQPVINQSETVDVGFGTAKKDEVVSSVKSSNLDKTNKRAYTNIYEMISQEVPGAQVTGKSIRLQQGPGSITSSSEPLFVLDGVDISNIDNINPSDVSRIEVLKGPAASIYGTRGGNGVLVITTRK